MDFDRQWYTEDRLVRDIDRLTVELAQAGEPQTEEDRQHIRGLQWLLEERRQMLAVLLYEE